MTTIAVIAMGEMGAGIAGRLIENGARVLTSLEGRSAASFSRAKAAGVEILGEADMIEQAELVLSIRASDRRWNGRPRGSTSTRRQGLPAPWEYGTEKDFMFTATLYLRRMGRYNVALLATIVCFAIILFLLAPVSTGLADLIFQQ